MSWWARSARMLFIVGFLMTATVFLTNCGSGGSGDSLTLPSFAVEVPLTAGEVDRIIQRTAEAVDAPNMTIAVVDRVGRILGLWSRNPATNTDDLNKCVSLARTSAFMSSSQGPLSTRTLEFISTFHFPATFGALTRNPIPNNAFTLDVTLNSQRVTSGVAGTPQGPLWQIFSCNRGTPYAEPHLSQDGTPTNPATVFAPPDADFPFSKEVPPPRRIDFNGNELFNTPGMGLSYLPGGIPLYKEGVPTPLVDQAPVHFANRCIGAVGVLITDAQGNPDPAAMEFAAFVGAQGNAGAPFGQAMSGGNPDPNFFFPAPFQGAIFLVGVLLPYIENTTRPVAYNAGTNMGPLNAVGRTVVASQAGGLQPFGWIIGPVADPIGNFTQQEVSDLILNTVNAADNTRAAIRLPLGTPTKMWVSMTNLDGLILGVFRMEDAPIFSYDVSVSKARCVTYYSSAPGQRPNIQPADVNLLRNAGMPVGLPGPGQNGVAITTRTLAFLTQPFYPPGIDSSGTFPGPLYPLAAQNAIPSQYNRMGSALPSPGLQSGIIFFPGATPLYRNGVLIGGIGISGDGVEQDDFVTANGSTGFLPPEAIRADQFTFQGVRLPYFKFPQLPGSGN